MNKERTTPAHSHPVEAQHSAAAVSGTVHWRDSLNVSHTAAIGPALLDRELHFAEQIRTSNRYPHKRSYIGLHYFASTGVHVPHESLLEAETLAWLDMMGGIVAIAAQPMKITFADGTVHFPDFFALHSDNRQVLYDVKPELRISPKYSTQFANTRAVCNRIGWGYEVFSERSPQAKANLAFVSDFRHHRYHPGPEVAESLRRLLENPLPLDVAASSLPLPLPQARAAIFHLIWAGAISFDLATRISGNTPIERNSNAHA
ncbi:MAG: TnsA-like heteromeric transposase endonuclease subunit [Cryobacterium sp.]|nr:TnsA-like heteromeric transposase endonuclease subunit [Cryobacterium sp.]